MRIGIIVHSHSGNTFSVAERLKEEFVKAGHSVTLEKVIPTDPNAVTNIKLESNPEIGAYEMLIFGAPVRGFSLSPVMLTYLNQLPTLQGKTVSCYVTQQLKKAWMGGNRSIKQMQTVCAAKGGKLAKTGDIHWSGKDREDQISALVREFTAL